MSTARALGARLARRIAVTSTVVAAVALASWLTLTGCSRHEAVAPSVVPMPIVIQHAPPIPGHHGEPPAVVVTRHHHLHLPGLPHWHWLHWHHHVPDGPSPVTRPPHPAAPTSLTPPTPDKPRRCVPQALLHLGVTVEDLTILRLDIGKPHSCP